MGHKYHACPVDLDGYHFDSKAEARRYGELRLLERAGEISDLEVHPPYLLLDKTRDPYSGKMLRGITYEGDFEYVEDADHTVVEDVKGVETAAFRLKRRLFVEMYPSIELRIIKA